MADERTTNHTTETISGEWCSQAAELGYRLGELVKEGILTKSVAESAIRAMAGGFRYRQHFCDIAYNHLDEMAAS